MSFLDSVQVGDRLDAMDGEHKWYHAIVLAIAKGNKPSNVNEKWVWKNDATRALDEANEDEDDEMFLIHYYGWSSKWDRWYSRNVHGGWLAPLSSHYPMWQANVKVGDIVEACTGVYDGRHLWVRAKVLDMDEGRLRVQSVCSCSATRTIEDPWMWSDRVAKEGTHTTPTSVCRNCNKSYGV